MFPRLRFLPLVLGFAIGVFAGIEFADSPSPAKTPLSRTVFSDPPLPQDASLSPTLIASQMRPARETGIVLFGLDLTNLLKDSRVVTDEPALRQLHFSELTSERFERLARVPSAPFALSRSLPLLV